MTSRPTTITLILTALISTSYGMGIYLFGTLLPEMRADLGLSPEIIGRMAGFAQAGTIIASLTVGFVWPRIGARETVLAAQAIVALAMVLIGIASEAWQVAILLFVLGAMAASTWIPIVPLVQAAVPIHRRGVALGLISSGLAYGVFLVGLVAPPLIAVAGWRVVWISAGLLAFVFFVSGLFFLGGLAPIRRQSPSATAARIGGERLIGAGAAAIILINLFAGLAFHPFQTYLTLLFRDLHQWSMAAATGLWSAIGLGGMAGGLVFGMLADRMGAKWTLVLANILLLGACLTTWLIAAQVPVYLAMVVFGMAYNGIWGLFAAWISRSYGTPIAAQLMGLTLFASGIGSTSGNYSGGVISGLPGGYFLLYALIAAIVLVMTLVSAALPADRQDGRRVALDPHAPPS